MVTASLKNTIPNSVGRIMVPDVESTLDNDMDIAEYAYN